MKVASADEDFANLWLPLRELCMLCASAKELASIVTAQVRSSDFVETPCKKAVTIAKATMPIAQSPSNGCLIIRLLPRRTYA